MNLTVLHGCALDELRKLPADSVDCIVTSPPYWGLRDYGIPPSNWPAGSYCPMPGLDHHVEIPAETSCLGLEDTLNAFIGHIVQVFRECRRVLKPAGTAWVNMGDSYAGSRCRPPSGTLPAEGRNRAQSSMTASRRRDDSPCPRSDVQVAGLKAKDLVGQPWRVAYALQADGWYLRRDIVWHKPNAMPESAQDRPGTAHEYLFLLTKAARYHYDADAIAEPASGTAHARGKKVNPKAGMKAPTSWKVGPGSHGNGLEHSRGKRTQSRQNASFSKAVRQLVDVRRRRSVWTLPTEGYAEAHYATFPRALPRLCIRAGCPMGGTVLDPFGGSGTTGAVALEEGRNAILIEFGEHNLALIADRCAVTPGLPLQ